MDIFDYVSLFGGLAFFIFGMNVMSKNLEKLAGGKLEHLLKKMTSNPFVSMLLGAIITIAVQSSSATTVMLVGLVNSGIMQFAQTIGPILGANIGTTLTAWILSLSSIQASNIFVQMLKPENFSLIFAFIGVIYLLFSKKDKPKTIGTIFIGFAVLIYGMKMMSDSAAPLTQMEGFADLLGAFRNPLLALLAATLFTAVIQSSAASIGILQALSLSGQVTFGMAIPIVMGQNIGTCATSLISCIGTNTKAKRVAVVHVTIKIIGTAVCLSVYLLLDSIINFALTDQFVTPMTIAAIHTIFNILTTIIVAPFTKLLVRFTEWLVKEKESENLGKISIVDKLLFRSPSVAVHECHNATKHMAELSYKSIMKSFTLLDKYDEKIGEEILTEENEMDEYEDRLGVYLVRLSSQAISQEDSKLISQMLHAIGDFERMSDHAVNLLNTSKEINDKKISFSDEAKKELDVLRKATCEIMELTVDAYINANVESASKVEPLEQVIDDLISKIRSNHIQRLQTGNCTIELGFVLSDTLTNFERVSDHCSNVAVTILETETEIIGAHKYLNKVKADSREFSNEYNLYEQKYSIQ